VVIVAIGHTDREARKALPKQSAAAPKPIEQLAHWDRFLRLWRELAHERLACGARVRGPAAPRRQSSVPSILPAATPCVRGLFGGH
jgi:hypothetical protein